MSLRGYTYMSQMLIEIFSAKGYLQDPLKVSIMCVSFLYLCASLSGHYSSFLDWIPTQWPGLLLALTVPFPPPCSSKLMSPLQFELKGGKRSSDSVGLLLWPNFIQIPGGKMNSCWSSQEAENSAPFPGWDGCSAWDVLLCQREHVFVTPLMLVLAN